MKLQLSNLEKIFQLLIEAAKKTNCEGLDFSYNFYKTIFSPERANLYESSDAVIGSIDHDIERLYQCLSDSEPMREHFRYLGNILIALSDTLDANDIQL